MSILKLEPYSGISGDMFLGALAPLTDSEDLITRIPHALGIDKEVEVTFTDVVKNSIKCRKAVVTVKHTHTHHHHHAHHTHDHHHHDHHHSSHHHHDHHHAHDHRKLSEILHLIDHSHGISANAKSIAKAIFTYLGEAEAEVHSISLEKVHFHEVGAHDSILDIVGAAILIDKLGITKTYSDPICTGFGFVKTDHGQLAVPTPATEKLLHGMPCYRGLVESEMTTPTGAAILKFLNPIFENATLITVKSYFGAGDKDFTHPNALRASLCSEVQTKNSEDLILIQTNIDDMPGEHLGSHLQDQLLNLGALDVFLTPIIMKKSRPGVKLEVLCEETNKTILSDLILESTSTLGLRYIKVERRILDRELIKVETKYGPITLKVTSLPSGKKRAFPEYEDCKALALSLEIPTQEVYLEALKAFK
jgi:uncharacterized protein (TIGR00299 family) protein